MQRRPVVIASPGSITSGQIVLPGSPLPEIPEIPEDIASPTSLVLSEGRIDEAVENVSTLLSSYYI